MLRLDPLTENLTGYLRGKALFFAEVQGVGTYFAKAALRSAQRDDHLAEVGNPRRPDAP